MLLVVVMGVACETAGAGAAASNTGKHELCGSVHLKEQAVAVCIPAGNEKVSQAHSATSDPP